MTFYTKRRLAFDHQDLQWPVKVLRGVVDARADTRVWGLWHGIFGLASNEVILMTSHVGHNDSLALPQNCRVLEEHPLRATARPVDDTPLEKPGLYVFRNFSMASKDIDAVVALSSAAWQTFERGKAYRAQPMGLFAPLMPEVDCVMHLLTWYPDFASWQESRASGTEALQRFAARRAMTYSTTAMATRLDLP